MPFRCPLLTLRTFAGLAMPPVLSALADTSSFIQTILLVPESHRIGAAALADFNRQSGISPCPEDTSIFKCQYQYRSAAGICQSIFVKMCILINI